MTITQPREALVAAAASPDGLRIDFETKKEADNFRWRVYQIRSLKAEWLELQISRKGTALHFIRPKRLDVTLIGKSNEGVNAGEAV